jgi:translation initiation factor 1
MKIRIDPDRPLVWSSVTGRICPGCGKGHASCICKKVKPAPTGDGIARVRRETKGRGGKTVTVITGLPLKGDELKTLAGELKKRCGTGGTLKDGILEIQGDHCDQLVSELGNRGFKVKRAGG